MNSHKNWFMIAFLTTKSNFSELKFYWFELIIIDFMYLFKDDIQYIMMDMYSVN